MTNKYFLLGRLNQLKENEKGIKLVDVRSPVEKPKVSRDSPCSPNTATKKLYLKKTKKTLLKKNST